MTQPRPTGPLQPLRDFFLRPNTARFQHALEQMPTAVLVVAPRTGQFITINGRATALTGWTRSELLPQALAEVVLDSDALVMFHTIEPGNTRHVPNVPIRTRAGAPLWVDVRLSAVEESGETIALLQATPSEERQFAEQERVRQARLLTGLQSLLELFDAPSSDTLPLAVERIAAILGAEAAGLYRPLPNSEALRLEASWNTPPALPLLLNTEEAQALQTPISWGHHQRTENVLTLSARTANWGHLLAYPLGRAPVTMGVVFVAYPTSNPPPVNAAAHLEVLARQCMHLLRQIARHRHLLDAQRLTYRFTNQLGALKALVTEGFIVLNANGTVDDVNLIAAQMLGYRPEDLIGLRYEDTLVGDEGLLQITQQALMRADTYEREGRLHRRNGEAFPVMVRWQTLPDSDGGCVLVLHDLSRARAEQTQREYADHMAYVGASAQAFAHEVRGPLNNIAVGVQYLAARLPEADPLQNSIAKILAETTRLSDLMNNMLAWAKPIEPKLEPTDLSALLRRLMNRWTVKLQQRNIQRALHLPSDGPLVLADAQLLERVFINLIENALQAMPTGGHLTALMQVTERGPLGTLLEVRISDTGSGISEEHHRRIFDPYFTTKADGSGLGLAICKRILTVHHGAIDVESFPGVGTIFIVTLPILTSAKPESLSRAVPQLEESVL